MKVKCHDSNEGIIPMYTNTRGSNIKQTMKDTITN